MLQLAIDEKVEDLIRWPGRDLKRLFSGDEGRCVLLGKKSFLKLKRVDLGVRDFEPRSYGATN